MIAQLDPPKVLGRGFGDTNTVRVRRVRYTEKGYEKGQYVGEFNMSLEEAYKMYSALWMSQHSDTKGEILEKFDMSKIDSADEFTFLEEDHFSIGMKDSLLYEGINEYYMGYPGAILDKYGFEQMIDENGDFIDYGTLSGLSDVA